MTVPVENGRYITHDDHPPMWTWTGPSKISLADIELETGIPACKVAPRQWKVEIEASLVLNCMLPDKMLKQLS